MVGDDTLRVESDMRFYQRRAAQERTMAARSVTDAARARHQQLADIFMERAQEMRANYA